MEQIYAWGFLITFTATAFIMIMSDKSYKVSVYIGNILAALVVAVAWFISIPAIIISYGGKRK